MSKRNGFTTWRVYEDKNKIQEVFTMGKSELEKMHTCELYLPGDEDIAREQIKCLDRLYDFNMTRPT